MAEAQGQASELPRTPPPRPRTLLAIAAGFAIPIALAGSFFTGVGSHLDQTLPPSFRGFYQRTDDYLRELDAYARALEGVQNVEIQTSGTATLDDWAQGDVTVSIDETVSADEVLNHLLAWVDGYRPGQNLNVDLFVDGPLGIANGRWPNSSTDFSRPGD